ncbi:MAG TPA: EutN/CcmL family microcompartment protein [Phycisphaerae bacterium]|nr:EutN/CcmL family microcompartment protein [Phycisphaerae bacterium]
MFTAIVKGSVTATRKHPSMRGAKLMIVQPIDPLTSAPIGVIQIAADVLGAGVRSRVLVSSDGRGAQEMLKADQFCPVRLAIIGLVDEVG